MISSASAQIVNAIAESHLVTGVSGDHVEAYGPTMGVATAIIALGIAVTAALGPEKRGSRFETAAPAGADGVIDATTEKRNSDPEIAYEVESQLEKAVETRVERV